MTSPLQSPILLRDALKLMSKPGCWRLCFHQSSPSFSGKNLLALSLSHSVEAKSLHTVIGRKNKILFMSYDRYTVQCKSEHLLERQKNRILRSFLSSEMQFFC